MSRHVTTTLWTERLALMPLEAANALEMVGVLADLDLYGFTGGEVVGADWQQNGIAREAAAATREAG